MKDLIYGQFVADDVKAIFVEYELKRAGLGMQFLENLRSLLDTIRDNPRTFGRTFYTVRACRVRKFQHVVYYRILRNGDVVVFAVRHGRENPTVWKRRFRGS